MDFISEATEMYYKVPTLHYKMFKITAFFSKFFIEINCIYK